MKREIARKILTAITLIIIVIILCAMPWVVYARRSQIHENATLIRYTQLLLSHEGFYRGPIDGECNIQTQEAIKKNKGLPPATPSGAICTIQLLEDLNDKLTASLSTGTPESHEASIRAEIDQLKSGLSNTVTTLNGINGGISTHFITLSNSMATIAITALLSSIALAFTLILAFVNIYVPMAVRAIIGKELNTNVLKD